MTLEFSKLFSNVSKFLWSYTVSGGPGSIEKHFWTIRNAKCAHGEHNRSSGNASFEQKLLIFWMFFD